MTMNLNHIGLLTKFSRNSRIKFSSHGLGTYKDLVKEGLVKEVETVYKCPTDYTKLEVKAELTNLGYELLSKVEKYVIKITMNPKIVRN